MLRAGQKLPLSNNYAIPILGLGTWKSKPTEVYEAVKHAISVGYSHIDCAFVYQNEAEVGSAIQEKIQDGTISRDEIFVTSKLWSTVHRPALVLPALEKTLKDLQLDYLDLYLEGDELFPKDASGKWLYGDVDYVDTWTALEECVRKGLVRSLGVSNFNSQQIKRILDVCTIPPVVNQVECHPYLNQSKLHEYCKSKNIVLTAYSPLGSRDRPNAPDDDESLFDDKCIQSIAQKHKKTVAQILIRFQIERGIAVIPKSVNKSRIEENIGVFDFELDNEDMTRLLALNKQKRYLAVEWTADHPNYPFAAEY